MKSRSSPCLGAVAATVACLLAAATAVAQDTVTVDAATDSVIRGGLAWLARNQAINGCWSQGDGPEGEPVAITGYALMAFLSTGNLPDEGDYGRNVSKGVQYILAQLQPDGLFNGVDKGKYMYSQGIATVALSELYGETRSPVLRQRLAQMVSVIVNAQSPEGGWRYTPTSHDADISVTVLQVAALRAAKNAGLAVPEDTIDRAIAYVIQCCDAASGGFVYQAAIPSQDGRTPRPGQPGFARTAAAIYSLQVCGKYEDPHIAKGSDYLFANDSENQDWWPYGCYYAAPAEYMIGGDSWRRWYAEQKSKLLGSVIREGGLCHWDYSRFDRDLRPIYQTAAFITVLAMPYHYISLYQR